jgi:hypothetical protein
MSFSDKTVSGIRNRAMVALLWRCALTHRELLALNPADIDHRMATITLSSSKEARGRRLPMDPQTQSLVTLWQGERRKLKKEQGVTQALPLFCTFESGNFGQPLSGSYLRGLLVRGAKNAGLKKSLHAESFRDALAIELRQEGFNLMAVAHFLGDRTAMWKPRYHNMPDGQYSGTGLHLEGWLVPRNEIRFWIQGGTMVPVGPDAGELPEETAWTECVARSDGSLTQGPAQYEVVATNQVKEDPETRLARLEKKLDELSKLVESLVKEKKKR